jgi:hypothetical protein
MNVLIQIACDRMKLLRSNRDRHKPAYSHLMLPAAGTFQDLHTIEGDRP